MNSYRTLGFSALAVISSGALAQSAQILVVDQGDPTGEYQAPAKIDRYDASTGAFIGSFGVSIYPLGSSVMGIAMEGGEAVVSVAVGGRYGVSARLDMFNPLSGMLDGTIYEGTYSDPWAIAQFGTYTLAADFTGGIVSYDPGGNVSVVSSAPFYPTGIGADFADGSALAAGNGGLYFLPMNSNATLSGAPVQLNSQVSDSVAFGTKGGSSTYWDSEFDTTNWNLVQRDSTGAIVDSYAAPTAYGSLTSGPDGTVYGTIGGKQPTLSVFGGGAGLSGGPNAIHNLGHTFDAAQIAYYNPVPEPVTTGFACLALLGLAARRRQRKA